MCCMQIIIFLFIANKETAGGRVLIYPKIDMVNNSSDVNLFIKNCYVNNISNSIVLKYKTVKIA